MIVGSVSRLIEHLINSNWYTKQLRHARVTLTPPSYHPLFTAQESYSTIFPMFTAFLLFLDGVWWWQMGLEFYSGKPIDEKMQNGHHGIVHVYSLFTNVLLASLGLCAIISIILSFFQRRYGPKRMTHHFSEEDTQVEMFER